MRKLEEAVSEVLAEHGRASAKFARFNSLHEGYGVLLEESDELWDEIKKAYMMTIENQPSLPQASQQRAELSRSLATSGWPLWTRPKLSIFCRFVERGRHRSVGLILDRHSMRSGQQGSCK